MAKGPHMSRYVYHIKELCRKIVRDICKLEISDTTGRLAWDVVQSMDNIQKAVKGALELRKKKANKKRQDRRRNTVVKRLKDNANRQKRRSRGCEGQCLWI